MINYDRIELVPAPNRFFDEGAMEPPVGSEQQSRPDQSTAARELAYAQRAAAYESGLPAEYKRIRWGRQRSQSHPEHQVVLRCRTVRVVYDATLNVQLLEIYLVDGWAGIRAVQNALARASAAPRSAPLHPWAYAMSFFGFARNLLILSIRDALMEIERKAGVRLVRELSLSTRLVSESWFRLDIRASATDAAGRTEDVITDEPSPSLDSPVRRNRIFYTFGNADRAAALYPLVLRAVQARADVAVLTAARERLQNDINLIHEDATGGPPVGLELDLAEVEARIAEYETGIETLYQDIHAECPLALLAVPLLKLPFDRPTMEQTIGECLALFQGESERIAKAYAERTGKVGEWIPGEQPSRSPELLYAAGFAPEVTVVTAVLDGALRDPGTLAMASEGILRLLVEDGAVAFDSFEYMVLMHYITALQATLITERERRELLDRVVAKVSALVSLALWLVPAGRVVKLVSSAFGVSVLSFYTYSVLHQLAVLDRQVGMRLAALDRQNAAEIVALTELARMRTTYVQHLSETLLQEIALIVAARAAAEFQHLLHVRGVYLDLEALIAT